MRSKEEVLKCARILIAYLQDLSERGSSFCYIFLNEFYTILATSNNNNNNCYCNHNLKAHMLVFLFCVPALPSHPEMQD